MNALAITYDVCNTYYIIAVGITDNNAKKNKDVTVFTFMQI